MHIQIVPRQGCQRACDKQQGVARQEGRHHQSGFAEQNQEQNRVNPDAVLSNQLGKVHINVQNKINQKMEELHSVPFNVLKVN